jgi:DNA-binding transcriptional regulator LsrR (DeoR family)
MTIDTENRRLLYKISQAYYEDGLTQKQIGKRLGLSRIKVSRLLQRARDLKVVQIKLESYDEERSSLEHAVEVHYGIDEVITIPTPQPENTNRLTYHLGMAAAECLLRSIQGDESIAITWGHTLASVVHEFPPRSFPGLNIIQSIGGLNQPDSNIDGSELVRRMAQTFDARPLLLSSPGIVSSREVREALLKDPQISKVLNAAAKANIAIVGVGAMNKESVAINTGIFTNEEIQRLRDKGAVGDIGLNFYNSNGERVEDPINGKLIGLELEQIRKITRIIGVAGGSIKVEAIRAALRGKLINVLITDEDTASRLLQE